MDGFFAGDVLGANITAGNLNKKEYCLISKFFASEHISHQIEAYCDDWYN
jgi:hypothetical protein